MSPSHLHTVAMTCDEDYGAHIRKKGSEEDKNEA